MDEIASKRVVNPQLSTRFVSKVHPTTVPYGRTATETSDYIAHEFTSKRCQRENSKRVGQQ